MRRLAQPGMKFLDQARFTYSGLAYDQHQLAVALPRPLPASHQHGEFLVATHKGREAALPGAAPAAARPNNPVKRTGSGTPLSSWLPRSSATNSPATWRCTRAVTTTVPGSASACTRAATLGASP